MDKEITAKIDMKKAMNILIVTSCKNSLMNGDPNADGMQRMRSNRKGIATPASAKALIRRFVESKGKKCFYGFGEAETLNEKMGKLEAKDQADRTEKLSEVYWDLPVFGAILNTGKSPESENDPAEESPSKKGTTKKGTPAKKQKTLAKNITGAVQFDYAESVNTVIPTYDSITRSSFTKEIKNGNTEMGSRHGIEYGVFVQTAHYNPFFGLKNGMTKEHFLLMLEGIVQSYANYSGGSKTGCTVRKVYLEVSDDQYGQTTTEFREGFEITVPDNSTEWKDVKIKKPKDVIEIK